MKEAISSIPGVIADKKYKRIINNMKHTYEIYQIVKWLNKNAKLITSDYSRAVRYNKSRHVETNKVIEEYKRHCKKSEEEIGELIQDCIDDGFISQFIRPNDRTGFIKVSSNGKHLIDSPLGFPRGLVVEILKQNKPARPYIFSIAAFVLGILARYLYSLIN